MPKLKKKKNKTIKMVCSINIAQHLKNGTYTRISIFFKLHEKKEGGKKAAWVVFQNLNSQG